MELMGARKTTRISENLPAHNASIITHGGLKTWICSFDVLKDLPMFLMPSELFSHAVIGEFHVIQEEDTRQIESRRNDEKLSVAEDLNGLAGEVGDKFQPIVEMTNGIRAEREDTSRRDAPEQNVCGSKNSEEAIKIQKKSWLPFQMVLETRNHE